MKLDYPFEICYFLLKQIPNTRAPSRSPIRGADATDDLISLKLRFQLTAPNVLSGERDAAITFSAGLESLSHKRVSSRVSWIGK